MQHANVTCPACPTNMQPRSLAEIRCRLNDFAAAQNVRAFREILPFHLVQPASADFDDAENARARQLVARVLSLYAARNASVILAFGRPTPAWLPGVSPWCPMPPLANGTAWNRLRDALATAVARLVAWLGAPAHSSNSSCNSNRNKCSHSYWCECHESRTSRCSLTTSSQRK